MQKKCIKQTSENTSLLVVKDHHLLRGSRIIILEKLSSKELYSLLISAINHQPTSQKYFDNLFSNVELPCHLFIYLFLISFRNQLYFITLKFIKNFKLKKKETNGTVKFLSMIGKVFDCLNVSHFKQNVKGKPECKEYKDNND